MSIAEAYDMPVARAPLVPPSPPRAPDEMTVLGRMKAIRNSPIGSWGQRAYEEVIVQGRFFRRNTFILNAPDGIKHVLVDNYENYTRAPAGFRVLRPILGDGFLTGRSPVEAPAANAGAGLHAARGVAAVPQCWRRPTTPLPSSGPPATRRSTCARRCSDDARDCRAHQFSFGMDRHGAALRDFVTEYGERLAPPHFLDMVLPLGWPSPQDLSRARFRKRWTALSTC